MTAEQQTSIDLSGLLRLAIDSARAEIHTALVGEVIKYDADKQTADVRPHLSRHVPKLDGSVIAEELPILPGIRVGQLRAGGFFIHLPVRAGDTVLVVVCERDLSEWRRQGGVVDPADQRTHSLGGAVAIPMVWPDTNLLSGVDGTHLEIGNESGLRAKFTSTTMEVGGNTDAAALASKVDGELTKISTTLGTGSNGAGSVVFGTPYVRAAVGSTKLKVGG